MNCTSRFEEMLRSDAFLFLCVLCVALLSYGFEIFNFHLTYDEAWHAEELFSAPWATIGWIRQGRWGMALLNAIVLRQTVLPVVSSAICVAGVTVALYIFLASMLKSRTAILAGLSLGLSFPTLAFTLSFSTFAYGIGIGAICASFFIVHSHTDDYVQRFMSIGFGAFAISIYQPLAFTILIGTILLVCFKLSFPENTISVWEIIGRFLVSFVASILLYFLIDKAIKFGLGIPKDDYVKSFIDVVGLLQNPIVRLDEALLRTINILSVQSDVFGTNAFLMSGALVISTGVLFVSSVVETCLSRKLLKAGAIIVVFVIVILAEAVTPKDVPLRSVVYITFVVAALAGLAVEIVPFSLKLPLFILIFCACIDGAAVANRLFLSTELVYQKDQQLVSELLQRIRSQVTGDGINSEMELYVAGRWSWPPTNLTPLAETMGASFFARPVQLNGRAARILKINSELSFVGARKDSLVRVVDIVPSMPVWPLLGSVKVDKNLVIVKFSDFLPKQRDQLCKQGITSYCEQ